MSRIGLRPQVVEVEHGQIISRRNSPAERCFPQNRRSRLREQILLTLATGVDSAATANWMAWYPDDRYMASARALTNYRHGRGGMSAGDHVGSFASNVRPGGHEKARSVQ
jgi:hypothetical protein